MWAAQEREVRETGQACLAPLHLYSPPRPSAPSFLRSRHAALLRVLSSAAASPLPVHARASALPLTPLPPSLPLTRGRLEERSERFRVTERLGKRRES